MLIRIWRTGVAEGNVDDFLRFAHERSLPMFREHPRCLGVLFTRSSDAGYATVTFWPDVDAIDALERSELYRKVVTEILSSGLLTGPQTTEVLSVRGGWTTRQLVRESFS